MEHQNENTNNNSIKNYVDTVVNKSYLILDQIHESYFPFLEKSIYLSHSVEKVDKSKVSKTEFIIEQRIKHVENNCKQLSLILSKLSDNDPSKKDLNNRLKQLESEQKRIRSAFNAIQFKRLEKEHQQKEQEELLTRRFTTSNENSSSSGSIDNYHHQQFNSSSNSLKIDIDEDTSNKEKHHHVVNMKQSPLLSGTSNKMSKMNNLNNKLRNQKPLVKRVHQRYLDFSTDFSGMTKVFFKFTFSDWLLLFSITTVFCFVFLLIIWQTSVRQID